ncbi:MAG: UPF0489 family protein [Spirochaetota bacterium]
MKKIRLYTVEEHHEAFILWAYCVEQKILAPSGNCLLHVDAHSDFALPVLNTSLNSIKGDLKRIYDFTYRELAIGNFIYPAIYQGILDHIVWLDREGGEKTRQTLSGNSLTVTADSVIREKGKVEGYVQSKGSDGKSLIVGELVPKIKAIPFSDRKEFVYQYATLPTASDFPNPEILDIDLDYFSCIRNPATQREIGIEITAEAYAALQDPYHPFNLLYKKLRMQNEGGKCYVLLNEVEETKVRTTWKNDEHEILERIDRLVDFLRKKKIRPQIIDICRSRYSGFTPPDQWEFIEKNLIEKLSVLYDFETVALNARTLKQMLYA